MYDREFVTLLLSEQLLLIDCIIIVMNKLKSLESDGEIVLEVTPVKNCLQCWSGN